MADATNQPAAAIAYSRLGGNPAGAMDKLPGNANTVPAGHRSGGWLRHRQTWSAFKTATQHFRQAGQRVWSLILLSVAWANGWKAPTKHIFGNGIHQGQIDLFIVHSLSTGRHKPLAILPFVNYQPSLVIVPIPNI